MQASYRDIALLACRQTPLLVGMYAPGFGSLKVIVAGALPFIAIVAGATLWRAWMRRHGRAAMAKG